MVGASHERECDSAVISMITRVCFKFIYICVCVWTVFFALRVVVHASLQVKR